MTFVSHRFTHAVNLLFNFIECDITVKGQQSLPLIFELIKCHAQFFFKMAQIFTIRNFVFKN